MIDKILPARVAAAEATGDSPDGMLFPEEAAVVARAVEKRRLEFTTARVCARAALARLGLPPAPIVPGPRGSPTWPGGVVGSMTHCDGYRASAVALARDIITIGIDAEPHQAVPTGVLDAITVADERGWLRKLMSAAPKVCWDRLLFSAKESVYKAWFPLTHRMLGFDEAVVTVVPENETFIGRLLVPGPTVAGNRITEFQGRWLIANGLILTAVAVPAIPGSAAVTQ